VSLVGRIKLWLIGCGTPTPTKDRFGSSFVVELRDELIMIDCGPAATYKMVKVGLYPTRVNHLFFTHHHFDHNADYPCFLLCRWDQAAGKGYDLKVWGPPPTALVTERLVGENGAFAHDLKARLHHPASQRVFLNRGGVLPRQGLAVQVTEIGPNQVVKLPGWSMVSAKAKHVQPWLDCLSYRLDTAEGSIVFSGDTEPCESLRALSMGADVMVLNTWGRTTQMMESGEISAMMGTTNAAEIAKQAGARMLVLTHTGPSICTADQKEDVIREMSRIFEGTIVFGDELAKLDL